MRVSAVLVCAVFFGVAAGCDGDSRPFEDAGGFDGGPPGDGSIEDARAEDAPMGADADIDAGPAPECGDEGCDYCASLQACADECAWRGDLDGTRCWSTFDACSVATCWEPTLDFDACARFAMDEDFSSGSFNVHRYSAQIPAGVSTLSLGRLGGTFEPALLLADLTGALIYGGDVAELHPDVSVLDRATGRGDAVASVTVDAARATEVLIHVTGWSVVDSGFEAFLSTDARYRLSFSPECAPPMSESESIGSPNNGMLRNGERVRPHAGYVVADTGRDAYFGTEETVRWLAEAFDSVRAMYPMSQVVQVRDLSVEGGGEPSGPWPHASHESGRDVDVTYHLDACDPAVGCPISDVDLADFDEAATWALFSYWLERDLARFIFVDHGLQAVIYDEAVRRGVSATDLDRWFQYPRSSGTSAGVIRHEPNHRNHHHVRFRCPDDDAECIE